MRLSLADYENYFLDSDEDNFQKISQKTKIVKKEKDTIQKQRKEKRKGRELLSVQID